MISLSAVIITLNEERNIARCIESLQGVVDEILVIDSFSTDNTKEICTSYNVRFIENPWTDYSTQKNFGHQQASHDYILAIDADESLSVKLADSIRKLKSGATFGLYGFKRLTNYCGQWIRHGGWYPDKKIRLYDRRQCQWQGAIHETLLYPSDKKAVWLEGDCLHFSYSTINDHVKKAELFSNLMSKAAVSKGETANLIQIIFKPPFKFLRDYFFRLGFLDGYYGFVISRISAYVTFLKYVKMREMKSKRHKTDLMIW